MHQVSPATQCDAQAFCNLCQWIYECWATHANLFERLPNRFRDEDNVSFEDFVETAYGHCLGRLNEISHQYVILQIAKLHDPALQHGNENLSIDFFAKQEFWSDDEMPTIDRLSSELDGLYKKIEGLRNKILAHNDRSVYLKGTPLGIFPKGEDEIYFLFLAQLCLMIWNKFPNENWPYGSRVFDFSRAGIDGDPLCPSNEARELLELIVKAVPNIPNTTD